jgi:hypothetical protein
MMIASDTKYSKRKRLRYRLQPSAPDHREDRLHAGIARLPLSFLGTVRRLASGARSIDHAAE